MTPWASDAAILGFAALGAFVAPWLAMRALVPVLEESGAGAALNYRGRRVTSGLGLVWVVWVVGVQLAYVLSRIVSDFLPPAAGATPYGPLLSAEFMPFVLVLGAMALGFADDVFGSASDKGFGGHLSALAHRRLTTGALKLFGVGLLAAAAVRPDFSGGGSPVPTLAVWALQVLGIGLTANFVNLLDLRPGRALKGYSLVVVLACAIVVRFEPFAALVLLVLVMGPALAVWKLDVGERAMLGDAGANAAGALAGYTAVTVAPTWWGLAVYVAVMLAVNLVSERVSISKVIAGSRALNWLDGLGRTAEITPADPERDDSSKSSREVRREDK